MFTIKVVIYVIIYWKCKLYLLQSLSLPLMVTLFFYYKKQPDGFFHTITWEWGWISFHHNLIYRLWFIVPYRLLRLWCDIFYFRKKNKIINFKILINRLGAFGVVVVTGTPLYLIILVYCSFKVIVECTPSNSSLIEQSFFSLIDQYLYGRFGWEEANKYYVYKYKNVLYCS